MINFRYVINFLECGHFCLKYVLKKEKKKVVCCYKRAMMDLRLIREVLNEYFGKAVWYKNVNIDKINSRCFSLIKVGNRGYHYIVIERVKNGYVYYYDPLFVFLRKKRIDKFSKKWTNMVCLYR